MLGKQTHQKYDISYLPIPPLKLQFTTYEEGKEKNNQTKTYFE